MQVTFVELGDVPPNGDPNGDSAPPRPSEAEAIEAKEEPITPTDKPVVEEAEPVSEVPSETPAPEQPVDGSPPQPSSASFSELTGTGTLALGAKTHGTGGGLDRSEEHTSELQSLMRISYAVFCLKQKKHGNK